jgi:hypothetical protein
MSKPGSTEWYNVVMWLDAGLELAAGFVMEYNGSRIMVMNVMASGTNVIIVMVTYAAHRHNVRC